MTFLRSLVDGHLIRTFDTNTVASRRLWFLVGLPGVNPKKIGRLFDELTRLGVVFAPDDKRAMSVAPLFALADYAHKRATRTNWLSLCSITASQFVAPPFLRLAVST